MSILGYSFHREEQDYPHLTMSGWGLHNIIQLARRAGWDDDFHASDMFFDDQKARRLADAVEQTLDDIPDGGAPPRLMIYTTKPVERDTEFARQLGDQLKLGRPARLVRHEHYGPGVEADVIVADQMGDYSISPVDYWSGDRKDKLRAFITFAREGAFWIEEPGYVRGTE